MTAPTTQKRIIFVGSYLDLFNALQAAREQQDNERVTDALMERRADDRQAVDEAPWMLGALAYGDADLQVREPLSYFMPPSALGTRMIVSGGDCLEIDTKGGDSTDTELPF
jgi:hypothetical protein